MTKGEQEKMPDWKSHGCLYISLWAGGALVAWFVTGAICGYIGVIRTEYQTGPGQQAILVALAGSCYGLAVGGIVGLIAWILKSRGTRQR